MYKRADSLIIYTGKGLLRLSGSGEGFLVARGGRCSMRFYMLLGLLKCLVFRSAIIIY